jgi:hypothetical protein
MGEPASPPSRRDGDLASPVGQVSWDDIRIFNAIAVGGSMAVAAARPLQVVRAYGRVRQDAHRYLRWKKRRDTSWTAGAGNGQASSAGPVIRVQADKPKGQEPPADPPR